MNVYFIFRSVQKIGLDCIGLVALRFTFVLLWMIGVVGLNGYRLDCIGGGLDWNLIISDWVESE